MKYCKFCGKVISDEAIFCEHCGQSISSQTNGNPPQVVPIVNPPPLNLEQNNTIPLNVKTKKYEIEGKGIIAIVVGIILLIWFILPKLNNSPSDFKGNILSESEYKSEISPMVDNLDSDMKTLLEYLSILGENPTIYNDKDFKTVLYTSIDLVETDFKQVLSIQVPQSMESFHTFLQKASDEYSLFSTDIKTGIDSTNVNKILEAPEHLTNCSTYIQLATNNLK